MHCFMAKLSNPLRENEAIKTQFPSGGSDSRCRLVEEDDRRVVDELEGDAQSLALAPG
jgi:hypothetical protein